MSVHNRKYTYVDVCFFHEQAWELYRTRRPVKINSVVMVPREEQIVPAIVAKVNVYTEKDVPIPPERIPEVVRMANRKGRRFFKGVDMRIPVDLSVKTVSTLHGKAVMRTTPEERKRIKKQYRHHKDVKLIRSKPSGGSSSVLSRDDADVPTKEGIWIPVKLYGCRWIYLCPSCKALVKQTEYFCPICGAENSRQYTSITIKARRIPDDDGGVGVRRPSPDEGFDWDEFDESFSDTMPRW